MENKQKMLILKKYFEEKNFIIGDGIKYGADFLLYVDSKDKVHSRYAVILNRNYTYLQLLSIQRTCNSAKKELILVDVVNDKVNLTIIKRFLFDKEKT